MNTLVRLHSFARNELRMQINPILQFFTYKHLPEHLQEVSKPFCELAEWIVSNLETNPETSTALRKLLEAKDAAVRAKLFKPEKVELFVENTLTGEMYKLNADYKI